MKRVIAITILALSSLTAAACGADPTATPTATQAPAMTVTPTTEPDHEAIEAGEALYRSKGCSSCHGQDAEGGVGPALADHTREQVVAQVRNPVGAMPAYTTQQISDEELDNIVAFVLSLDGEGLMHHDDHTIEEHHQDDHVH